MIILVVLSHYSNVTALQFVSHLNSIVYFVESNICNKNQYISLLLFYWVYEITAPYSC